MGITLFVPRFQLNDLIPVHSIRLMHITSIQHEHDVIKQHCSSGRVLRTHILTKEFFFHFFLCSTPFSLVHNTHTHTRCWRNDLVENAEREREEEAKHRQQANTEIGCT